METIWTPEQQKEHRKLWVDALRSGKYQQGDVMNLEGRMCCLAVGCEVSGIGEWVHEDEGCSMSYRLPSGDEDSIQMPDEVAAFFGLRMGNGKYHASSLMRDNDTLRLTFAQIADIIESEPEGLIANA